MLWWLTPRVCRQAEGINNKIKVIKRDAYGYHDERHFSLKVKQTFDPNCTNGLGEGPKSFPQPRHGPYNGVLHQRRSVASVLFRKLVMQVESNLPLRFRRLTSIMLLPACLTVGLAAGPVSRAEAGSLVIPAWSFARGNARVYADPAKYADAGPVVGSGPEEPWGWRVEYDVDFPVSGKYTLEVSYAAAEARPMEVFFDNANKGKVCTHVTFGPASAGKAPELTWNSSGARWETFLNQFGGAVNLAMDRRQPAKAGKHTIVLASRRPLPHLVALRLTTAKAFPASWQPPQYKVRDLESIPAAHRKAFEPRKDVDVAALRQPAKGPQRPRAAGSLTIAPWTFDRGNVEIYGSPDEYAQAGPLTGGGPDAPEQGVVEYDIDFPVTGDYALAIRYAAAEPRPVDVFLDGKNLGKACTGITFGSAPFEKPVRFSADSWAARKTPHEVFSKDGEPVKLSVTQGKHTLKLTRRGPLPNLMELRLDSLTAFPKDWKQAERKIRHLDRVPPEHRATFLPPEAVNIEALRLAIRDTMATFGPEYAGGKKYLKQLTELEKKQKAAESGAAEGRKKIEDELKALRRQAMLAHPSLDFDHLLFLKRDGGYGHTYTDQHAGGTEGNLCILSPVAADGKVTELVPELTGGLFDRFDLAYDAKKVVFGYKKEARGTFRIYEIDIDPAAGKMVPGSLRQLTFGGKREADVIKACGWQGRGADRGFDDMDPVYLPDGRILFASTRSQRNTFCGSSSVTTLYIMDADGKNLRCLSAGPINEHAPSVLNDGRVIYTRWEYVDKGLGNGESLWAIRPDGSGVDHVYKNNTVRPAGMSNARSIPGSQSFVTIGGTHHNTAIGSVILVDPRVSRRGTAAMRSLTPEIGYPCMAHPVYHFGFFMDPYPFSETFFLVSHAPGQIPRSRANYGIYVLDAWGNRAELCRDPKLNCYEPIPLRPRRKPMAIASLMPAGRGVADAGTTGKESTGTLFVQNVYEGMTGIEPGRVKYLRVVGPLAQPWGANHMNRIGLNVDVHRKRVYGVVKVQDDGSAYFRVPANENILFQALDENFMALQHMATFINMMPGETRSCIGCHEHRRQAPGLKGARPLALKYPPQTIQPQPGDVGPRTVDYAADVQPVLDKHCVRCHGGKDPKARLDLTGVPTGRYNRSYENIIGRELICYMDCRYGRSGYRAFPPLTHFSPRSKLAMLLLKGHKKVKLPRGELLKIVTWIDANAPYYGTYRGKRELEDKDSPDFRLPPLVVAP